MNCRDIRREVERLGTVLRQIRYRDMCIFVVERKGNFLYILYESESKITTRKLRDREIKKYLYSPFIEDLVYQ